MTNLNNQINMRIPATGCLPSKKDIRTFSYPTKGVYVKEGGTRYEAKDILDQSRVGICTANNMVQNAMKATGREWSADFQYLAQKYLYDGNWNEGSTLLNALKVAKNVGFLPVEEWTHTTQADRDAGYAVYIKKLQEVTREEFDRLCKIANKHKHLKAYTWVQLDRDSLAEAILDSKSGILVRYNIGNEWWTGIDGIVTWDKNAIQPLRAPKQIVSGHAVTETNFDGGSFRIANGWGPEWCQDGTAYHMLNKYAPKEAWAPFYEDIPEEVVVQLENRDKIIGMLKDIIQKLLEIIRLV